MGLFSFLKSDTPTYSDKVWRTREAAVRGMITDAMLAITRKEIPIVIGYFEEGLQVTIQFLKEKGVPFQEVNESIYALDEVVYVVSAQRIQNIPISSLHVTLLFFGHYPLPAKESTLLKKLQAQIPEVSIVFYSSLDEPSFRIFGGERITEMLDKLGMKADEAIEHNLVTRSMQRAREKIQRQVRNEIAATSEVEWFNRNVKS